LYNDINCIILFFFSFWNIDTYLYMYVTFEVKRFYSLHSHPSALLVTYGSNIFHASCSSYTIRHNKGEKKQFPKSIPGFRIEYDGCLSFHTVVVVQTVFQKIGVGLILVIKYRNYWLYRQCDCWNCNCTYTGREIDIGLKVSYNILYIRIIYIYLENG